jgi:cysteine peptidase B
MLQICFRGILWFLLAFSATEQIESDIMRTLGKTVSPEQITQCDKTSYGCNGGWTEHAYDYVTSAGGIEINSDYSYTSSGGTTGSCHADASKFVASVISYTTVSGESNMASYVESTGPLSVCLDASSWNSYNGGIMKSCGKSVDHCVQAVGVDTSSYSVGEKLLGNFLGRIRLHQISLWQNTCNIASDPTYTEVK